MKKIGNQNPTQSVILPYKKSLDKEAIKIYECSGRKAQKWQKSLIKHILSTNQDKLWVHTKFGYSLPRRNGKNEVIVIRELFGLIKGEQILHTAHRTQTSGSAWKRLVKIINDIGYVEGQDYKKLAQKGLEEIQFFESGGNISFRTRTNTGGLGEGFDLLIIDEAQEYTTDQESTLKYVVTDSKNPQTIFCGTPPTLVSNGTVFKDLRDKVLMDNTKNAGWAEWGVEHESDVNDKELWYLTNPSLGTIFTERSIEDEIGSDTIDFNIQRLGLWIKYNQKSVISEKDWLSLKVDNKPNFEGKMHVGIKFGKNGENVALSIAIKTDEGKVFIESVDCRPIRSGTQWLIQFLQNKNIANIVIDGAGMQTILAEKLKEYKIKHYVLPTVKEVIVANSKFEQSLYQGELCHNNQPSLTAVATNCEKRNIGTQGGFGYNSIYADREIALLDSVILAHWSCVEVKERKKQRVYY